MPRRARNHAKNLEVDEDQTEETSFTTENKDLIRKQRAPRRTRREQALAEPVGNDNNAYEHEETDDHETAEPTDEEPFKIAKKIRRRGKRDSEEVEAEARPTDPNILAVIIHQSDKLRTDINLYHPMVRVHIIDLDMDGEYVKKLDKERNVLCYYEKENRRTDYVPPIMTTPFDFKSNRSVIPKWEEILVFNEQFNYFTQNKPSCLLMFEILDTAKSTDVNRPRVQYTSQDTGAGWQRVAWAFLKIVGANKHLNTEKKIRLQLYYTQTQYKNQSTESMIPEIYTIYKNGPRVKYPASLHVTIKSILPPSSFQPGIRSLFSLNQAQLHSPPDAAQDPEKLSDYEASDSPRLQQLKQESEQKSPDTKGMWSRVAGLPCRVPNDRLLKLNSAKNGCYSLKFSTTGSYLACACVEEGNVSPIYIYQIPSGKLVMKFQGHMGLVYEMSWSKGDNYLVTASNDATARVIDVESRSKTAYKILPHPSFLYTAKFHPNSSDMIVTSGYDKVVRVWTIGGRKKAGQKYGQLLQELFGHVGYVNSSCFSGDGAVLYTADSVGKILAWNCGSVGQGGGKEEFSEWALKEEIDVDELQGQCVNQIQLQPNQFRLLVHLRENEIKLVDLRLKAVVKRYRSSFNFTQNIKSAMSPCGTFLFSCGADTKIHCWNIDTGDQVTSTGMSLDYMKPARDIDFHPYDNIIAICSFDTHSPIYVFSYNPDKARHDANTSAYLNTLNRTGQSSKYGRMIETEDDTYQLPNMTEEFDVMKKKLADDVARFTSFQSKRWQDVQEKLDSVHPSQKTSMNRSLNPNLAGQITLSVDEHTNAKPEFKYRGPKEVEDLVVALYDYTGQRNDELSLCKGDELLVLVRENENWWMGEMVATKQQGYFPANYVQDKALSQANLIKKPPSHFMPVPKYSVKDALNEIEPLKTFGLKKKETEVIAGNDGGSSKVAGEVIVSALDANRHRARISRILGKEVVEESEKKERLAASEIDEVPTRDISAVLKHKAKDGSKRKSFAHIISGNPDTFSEA